MCNPNVLLSAHKLPNNPKTPPVHTSASQSEPVAKIQGSRDVLAQLQHRWGWEFPAQGTVLGGLVWF